MFAYAPARRCRFLDVYGNLLEAIRVICPCFSKASIFEGRDFWRQTSADLQRPRILLASKSKAIILESDRCVISHGFSTITNLKSRKTLETGTIQDWHN